MSKLYGDNDQLSMVGIRGGGDVTDTLLTATLTAAGGIIVAAITGVLSYRSARWNLRRDLEVDLRRERLEAFKALWILSEPIGRYAAVSGTPASMEKLSGDLRHWYFAQGGIFLTVTSREAYFKLQEALQEVVVRGAADKDQELDAETRRPIEIAATQLRNSLQESFKGFPQM